MPLELECKIRIRDRAPLAACLEKLGAKHAGETEERNWVMDTPEGRLKQQCLLLRLRALDNQKEGILTVKGPAQDRTFKAREEIEVGISSTAAAQRGLELLGYKVAWYYEKRRDRWYYQGCEIALDELPEIGCFVEIEGPDDASISKVLQQLQLDPSAHIKANYLMLFAEHCAAQGVGLTHMRFTGSQALRSLPAAP